MSQMIVRESSDSETSDDDELEDKQQNDVRYVRKMMLSKSKVDQRLIKLYKLRKADKTGQFIDIEDIRGELKRKGINDVFAPESSRMMPEPNHEQSAQPSVQ